MFVEISLGLRDVPGMLVRALEPISANGGNIMNVVHSRGAGGVKVSVAFKVRDDKTLRQIFTALKDLKVEYGEVRVEGNRYFSKRRLTFILVGHVIDTDMQDTIDEINRIGLVRDIDVRMSNPNDESAVMMRVNVDEGRLNVLMERVAEVCQKKGFLLVSEVVR